MDLGQYRFLPEQGCLQQKETGEHKLLTRSELLVLSQLVSNPGTTLSKHSLSCGDEDSPLISESAVVKAIFTLRHTLGEPAAGCIHTVPKEGYQFVPLGAPDSQGEKAGRRRLSPRFVRTMQLLSVMAVILVSFPLLYQTLSHHYEPPPVSKSTIEVHNDFGQVIEVEIVTSSPANVKAMQRYADDLTHHLAGCVYSPWKKIKLALSHDQQMLNITMFGEGKSRDIRNMKISDFRVSPEFINPEWLKRVSICE